MISKFYWTSSSIQPSNYELPVLCCTENNKLVVFKNTKTCLGGNTNNYFSGWDRLVEKYHISYWVYQEEVINTLD